jgi:MarR family transcriptional regulator, 2-MHQ and catechol-resistance regulon repressor
LIGTKIGQRTYTYLMATNAMKRNNADGTHVFLVVWKAYRALLAKASESIRKVGLCDSDFRVLEALLHKGPLPVNVIGDKVELTTGSITTAVDRMEAKWLVVRKSHPEDRRVRLVELTAKGRRLIEQAYAQHSVDMECAVKALSRRERATLIDLLKRLGKGPQSESRLVAKAYEDDAAPRKAKRAVVLT